MSQENVEAILQGLEAVNRQDVDAFVAQLTPDVEWEDAAFWSEPPRTYRGRAEVREWLQRVVVEPWESIHTEADEVIEAADDRVFGGGLITARGRGSGVETRFHGWAVFWVAGGRVRKRRPFRTRDEPVEAVGLRE